MADTSAEGHGNYSYFQKEFVSFYDQMVLECFGGTKAHDVKAYSVLLQQLLLKTAPGSSDRDLVVVDLGCGSGRATLAFVEHLAPMVQPKGKHLHLYGVDNSAVFLEAAKSKCDAFLQQHDSLRAWVTVDWLLGSFEDWKLPTAPHTHADLILVAGAGLHHVTSTAGLSTTMQLAAQRLSPGGFCVLSYLPWAELYRQDNSGSAEGAAGASGGHTVLTVEEFRVQGFRRVLLSRHVDQQADGSVVLHERFALSKLAASPSGAQPSGDASSTNSGSGSGEGETSEAWRIEEGWQLRKLDREELLGLAADAGLCETSADVVRVMGCDGGATASAPAGSGAGHGLAELPGAAAGEVGVEDSEGHGSHFVVLQHAAGK